MVLSFVLYGHLFLDGKIFNRINNFKDIILLPKFVMVKCLDVAIIQKSQINTLLTV